MDMSEKLRKSFLLRFRGQQDEILMMLLNSVKDLAVGVTGSVTDNQLVVISMFIKIGAEPIRADLDLGVVSRQQLKIVVDHCLLLFKFFGDRTIESRNGDFVDESLILAKCGAEFGVYNGMGA